MARQPWGLWRSDQTLGPLCGPFAVVRRHGKPAPTEIAQGLSGALFLWERA
ncbi:hypothetical protein PMI38_04089, partial [Pseudomonas sp. GM84]